MAAGNPFAGPVPKKDAERRRRNKNDGPSSIPADVVNVDELLAGEVEIPAADEEWHPIARQIYDAQAASGQVIFMEPSDWSMLYLMCESISRDLSEQVVGITEEGDVVRAEIPLKGASLSAYLKGFEALMVAEGGRRRLRLELERKKRIDAAAAEDGKVVDIVQHRADVFKGA